MIPKIMNHVIKGGGEFTVFGIDYDTPDGSCLRDYIHPTDLANAHLMCLEKEITGVYNLGTSRGVSVWEIVKETVAATDTDIEVVHGKRRAGDPPVLVANPNRFMERSGWEPSYSIGEIVRTAYKAYKKVK